MQHHPQQTKLAHVFQFFSLLFLLMPSTLTAIHNTNICSASVARRWHSHVPQFQISIEHNQENSILQRPAHLLTIAAIMFEPCGFGVADTRMQNHASTFDYCKPSKTRRVRIQDIIHNTHILSDPPSMLTPLPSPSNNENYHILDSASKRSSFNSRRSLKPAKGLSATPSPSSSSNSNYEDINVSQRCTVGGHPTPLPTNSPSTLSPLSDTDEIVYAADPVVKRNDASQGQDNDAEDNNTTFSDGPKQENNASNGKFHVTSGSDGFRCRPSRFSTVFAAYLEREGRAEEFRRATPPVSFYSQLRTTAFMGPPPDNDNNNIDDDDGDDDNNTPMSRTPTSTSLFTITFEPCRRHAQHWRQDASPAEMRTTGRLERQRREITAGLSDPQGRRIGTATPQFTAENPRQSRPRLPADFDARARDAYRVRGLENYLRPLGDPEAYDADLARLRREGVYETPAYYHGNVAPLGQAMGKEGKMRKRVQKKGKAKKG